MRMMLKFGYTLKIRKYCIQLVDATSNVVGIIIKKGYYRCWKWNKYLWKQRRGREQNCRLLYDVGVRTISKRRKF